MQSTRPNEKGDIGAFKAKILANDLYRSVGADVTAYGLELIETNAAKLLTESMLVIDTFDNSAARRLVSDTCRTLGIACLHAGLADGYGEVIWDEVYKIPSNAQDDICDYPLARNLVLLTVAVACEIAVRFVADSTKRSYSITLEDLRIEELTF